MYVLVASVRQFCKSSSAMVSENDLVDVTWL